MEHPVLSSIILAGIAAAALVVCCAAALLFARRRLLSPSLPRTKGTLVAAGIGAPVTIARDAIGVPHIDAESMEDAVYALGVAHAQDRLWQLEMTRRVAQGRVSEIVGADGLDIDRIRPHFPRRCRRS